MPDFLVLKVPCRVVEITFAEPGVIQSQTLATRSIFRFESGLGMVDAGSVTSLDCWQRAIRDES